jgi:hypothetical protein
VVPTSFTNRFPDGYKEMSLACQSAADCLAVWGSTLERFNGSTWQNLTLRSSRGLPSITLLGATPFNGNSYLVVGTTDYEGVSGKAVIGVLDGQRLSLIQD